MNFDEQSVGANGDGRTGERQNLVTLPGAMAGVDENGQVAALFDRRDDREVQSVARKVRKGPNAALAQHHVVVALGEEVLRGHEKFIEGGGHAALEKNGLLGAAGALEEREILHVARANLDDVGVFFDELERFVVDSFGDDAETMLGAHFRENLGAVFAESLKAVRGSTRFVSAAAKQPRARLFDALGNRKTLLLGFHGGAYKPRTSPYGFQGLGESGLKILSKVRAKHGFGIVTEAIDNESLELVEEYSDVIQIGARNMQNFSLLKRAGRAKKRSEERRVGK